MRLAVLVVAVAALGAIAIAAPAGTGDLDPAFDGDGKVVTPGSHGGATAMALQPDGKIVTIGTAVIGGVVSAEVARYRADGGLDPTFAGDGIANVGGLPGVDVVVQPDGKLLVIGFGTISGATTPDVIVARLNANGTIDPSWSADGYVNTDVFGFVGADRVSAGALQPDGKLVVVGGNDSLLSRDFFTVRYNANGSLDTAFAGDGIATTNLAGQDDASSVAVQADGRIVVAGRSTVGSQPHFAMVRLNADGTLDTSFDGDGKVITFVGAWDAAYDVALPPTGGVVLVGDVFPVGGSTTDLAIARYTSTGSLDPTFDGDGILGTNLSTNPGGSDGGAAIQVLPDGDLVVVGVANGTASAGDFVVARVNPDGSFDRDFSGDGTVLVDFGGIDAAAALALQPDRRIVVSGGTRTPPSVSTALALARLENEPYNKTYVLADPDLRQVVAQSYAGDPDVVVAPIDRQALTFTIGSCTKALPAAGQYALAMSGSSYRSATGATVDPLPPACRPDVVTVGQYP